MKRFTVRPRLFHTADGVIGHPEADTTEWVLLGRLSEAGPVTRVRFDVRNPHVVAVFGKRGVGKSYTLGSILEGLCTVKGDSSISCVSQDRAALLFDTLGIFQWMDVPLEEDAQQEIVREQYAVRRGWDLESEELRVRVWLPRGTASEAARTACNEFSVNCSDFTASDWGYLLNLDIYQDRMGQLLNDAYVKVVLEGWQEGPRHHPPELDYTVDDLIACVKSDGELLANYASETQRAVVQQLTVFKRNPLFHEEGTRLNDLLRPGQLSILVMNRMSEELRLVVTSALIRRIIAERIQASETEKHLQILSNLDEQERLRLQEIAESAVPPSWVVIDEAQNILPSERRTSATDVLVRFVREGRNYGLSFMVATQQPSAVDQRILAQVDTIIAHKLTVQTDIDYVRRNLKSSLPAEVKYANAVLSFDEVMRSLDVGQAFVSDTETPRGFVLEIRPRVSVHGGF